MSGMLFDVAGPGLLLALGLGLIGVPVSLAVMILVEAAILRLMRWGKFTRALLASLAMNLVSFGAGFFAIGLWNVIGRFGWLLVAFGLSILIEGGVLTLMNRGQTRLNWLAALAVNVATYIPITLLVFLVGP